MDETTTSEVAEIEPVLEVELKIKANPDVLDADNYVTIWNVASSTTDGDYDRTRQLAGKLLCFLCKHRFPYIVASQTDMQYLDDWFERDTKLLYNWKDDSEMVDVVAQHASLPFDTLTQFLDNNRFKTTGKYSAGRSARLEWFQSDWNVG